MNQVHLLYQIVIAKSVSYHPILQNVLITIILHQYCKSCQTIIILALQERIYPRFRFKDNNVSNVKYSSQITLLTETF